MDTASALALWFAGIAAGLAGLGYIARKTIQGVRVVVQLGRKLDALADLAEYELNHNGGASIKDAVTRIPGIDKALTEHIKQSNAATEQGARDKAEIDTRLQALETQRAQTIANLAEALPVVARSTPAAEDGD